MSKKSNNFVFKELPYLIFGYLLTIIVIIISLHIDINSILIGVNFIPIAVYDISKFIYRLVFPLFFGLIKKLKPHKIWKILFIVIYSTIFGVISTYNPSIPYPYIILNAYMFTILYYILFYYIDIENFNQRTIHLVIKCFIILFVILLLSSYNILDEKFLDWITRELLLIISILITIIMLCIALSTLSFNYSSILNDTRIEKNMKRNGETYFIASILSMFSILSFVIVLFIKHYVVLRALSDLNIISLDFIGLSVYPIFIVIAIIFAGYSIYYIIKCSYSTLNIWDGFDFF